MNLHSRQEPGTPAPSMDILGVRVANPSRAEAIALIRNALSRKRHLKVAFLNAHSANVAATDPEFCAVLDRFLVLPDGIGVDIAARRLYGRPFRANLNGTDFVPALLSAIGEPLTVGIVGAVRENGEKAAAGLAVAMPQHRFVYLNDGYLSKAEEPDVLRRIRELAPDILLVAMGVPRQEKWIDRNIDASHCTVPMAVGALLDFLSGAIRRAPPVVRRFRLEWLFRLVNEPVRLWRRYVLGNPLFLMRVVRQKARMRREGVGNAATGR
jgi:exopolysaccharide biosynthesis WecB/TagA/CpsF family protein